MLVQVMLVQVWLDKVRFQMGYLGTKLALYKLSCELST